MTINRSKGAFRAMREACGLSQHDAADAFDVQERTVRRWESCDPMYAVPDYAWDWLEEMAARREDAIDTALEAAEESGARVVSITYYRSQEEYDALGRDDGPCGFANAVSREVAFELSARGYEVSLLFPEEADDALAAAIMQTREEQ